jgi:anti-sigma28 factor (negative regulator of flagellin synthesis)
MANTTKYIAPGTRTHAVPAAVLTDPGASCEVRLSPHVEALRRLVASGQYQVSPRYLAQRILRSAGIKLE